jgi:predicted nucleic acid-binding protein
VILVDTGIWIALLRKQEGAPVERLRQLLIDGDAAIAPVIVQELLQGAASQTQLGRLSEHFLALPMLAPRDLAAAHAAAGALYARCRWAGITPRSPHDCLIAQTAIEHDVALLHDDRDFEFIAGTEPKLRLLRG